MRHSRQTVIATSAACLCGLCVSPLWADGEIERFPLFSPGSGKARLTPTHVPHDAPTHTPGQRRAPRAPTQFNPDPGGSPVPRAPMPQVRPRVTIPDVPLDRQKLDAPKPGQLAPELPTGTPLDTGVPGRAGTPLIPSLPDPQPGLPDLRDRPSLFGDDFLYIPRFDNEAIPSGLALPRRGVRSQEFRSNIFHYREYPPGQEGLGLLPLTQPFVNRWAIPFPKWQRYLDPSHETPYGDGRETIKWWHPYEQSKLKGDAPIIGQEIFANVTMKSFALGEYRRLPVPSGVSAATGSSSEFFGRGEQHFLTWDRSLTFELFKGETTFKPIEWMIRAQVVKNDNWIWVREQNLLDPDPRGVNHASGKEPKTSRIGAARATDAAGPEGGPIKPLPKVVSPADLFRYISPQLRPAGAGREFVAVDSVTNDIPAGAKRGINTRPENKDHQKDFARTRNTYRHKDFIGLQEAFFEIHLGDLSDTYDFWAIRAGIQPFVSDFRGFVFSDTNLGVRNFGSWDNNRLQWNVAYFNMREKDTYSGLNMFEARDQRVFIANVYRQDFLWKGYTAQASLHVNLDDGQTHFDKNDFLVRPAQLGDFTREHDVRTLYLGWAGDGHIGRWNISHAFYWVLGEDEFNGLAGRRIDVNAQFAAVELSYDFDWLRVKASGVWASGDRDPSDDHGTGFDSIVDAPFFIGGPFSWYVHQGINLGGTAVNLKNPDSLIPSLRSSKTEGQSNFVNPGVKIVGLGLDADVTPKLRAFLNANYIWFDHTEPIENAIYTNHVSDRLGLDLSLGVKYRPLLTENIIVGAGVGFFFPGDGFNDIYRRNSDQIPGFGPQDEEGEADDVLWNAVLSVTLTF
jgi:hypothetical protein